MSGGTVERKRPGPDPRRVGGSESEERDGGAAEGARSPSNGPPQSVRETMPRGRRYNTGSRRPAPARRRKPARNRARPPSPARGLDAERAREVPTREVEEEDGIWRVRLAGSSEVGSGASRGPRLLSVELESPGDVPNPDGTHYVVARDLDAVDEDVLRGLVRNAVRATRQPGSSRPARRLRGSGPSRRRVR